MRLFRFGKEVLLIKAKGLLSELEFAVFCIENVAAKLGVDAKRVYQAFTEKSDIQYLAEELEQE